MSNAGSRAVCVEALDRWEKSQQFADEVIHTALNESSLSALDRGFVTELFYGVLRNRRKLDFIISLLRDGGVDPATRQILRVGLYQVLHMRVPEHAAVNETVAIAGRAKGLVNALMRRTLREIDSVKRQVAEASLAVRESHPDFLIERWEKAFGPEKTLQLAQWNNTPATIHVRANTLKITAEELAVRGAGVKQNAFHPAMLDVESVPMEWLAEGLCYVQDPSTLIACDLLAPQPGETVLDACAAPGGKTTYMAALMKNEGRIAACDSVVTRVERLRDNLIRLGVMNTQPIQMDWIRGDSPFEAELFDRILVDAPCSNTGVLRRRVDARWRLDLQDFERMPRKQLELVARIVPLLKPGGSLVYSTCSIEREENTAVAEQIAREHSELELKDQVNAFPFQDGVDGAFAALFVKKSV